jgi:hypothetical protein
MKQLEKEILSEMFDKNELSQLEEEGDAMVEFDELKQAIQLTQSKIIQIIDKRIEELKSQKWIDNEDNAVIEELESLKKGVK